MAMSEFLRLLNAVFALSLKNAASCSQKAAFAHWRELRCERQKSLSLPK